MNKIVIDGIEFPADLGIRVWKMKGLQPIAGTDWGSVKPLSFAEVAALPNMTHRQVIMRYSEINKAEYGALVSKVILDKTTTWVDRDGSLKTHEFKDTYELFRLLDEDKQVMGLFSGSDLGFVAFKDTSTDREYLIWVDMQSVKSVNGTDDIDAIHAIAWTIQTDVPHGMIEEIVRQGDCVLVKPVPEFNESDAIPRHITKAEYVGLLRIES